MTKILGRRAHAIPSTRRGLQHTAQFLRRCQQAADLAVSADKCIAVLNTQAGYNHCNDAAASAVTVAIIRMEILPLPPKL